MPEKESKASEINALLMENHKMQREMASMHNKLQRAEADLQTALGQTDKMRVENDRFRSIILGQANTQKVSDDEVISRFAKIRQDIQRLARNPAYDLDRSVLPSREGQPTYRDMARFYSPENWEQLLPKDRVLRMRAQVFGLLYEGILAYHCFGLRGIEGLEDDEGRRSRTPREGRHSQWLGAIEPGLRAFERLLRQKKGESQHPDLPPRFLPGVMDR